MGDVYKAEDTRLKRLVALKFLSKDVTGSGESAERFLREARAAAALDHPNICTVHEIDNRDGQMFLAMAYLDGVPLDEKIQSGPLPLTTIYEIAKQAAEGLAAAHAGGVVHRDIKSSNIMVNEDRAGRPQVKLMDFGLAQLSGASKLTKVETRMGTVAYMSPEQSQGEEVGPPSDLWSLGVVIYEMVTGELPFKGHYDQAILYSILQEEPTPITALRSRVPMELEWIVEKCLAKMPAERYQDAGELVVDLDRLARRAASGRTTTVQPINPSAAPEAGPQPEFPARRALGSRGTNTLLLRGGMLAGSLAIVAGAFLLGRAFSGSGEEAVQPTRRFTVQAVEATQAGQRVGHLAISPDGHNIAFSTTGPGGSLWLRALDRHEPTRIDGTEGARDVFWSPDSNSVGFLTNRRVGKVALRGLTVTMMSDDVNLLHASAAWSADGQSILVASLGARPMIVPALGGAPKPLAVSGPWRRVIVTSPSLIGSADGGEILLYAEHTVEGDTVMARPFSDGGLGEPVRLVTGLSPAYSESGHILYRPSAKNSDLWAVRFSSEDLEVLGEPFQVAQNASEASVSSDGTLAYLDDPFTGQQQLVWVNSRGETVGQIGKPQFWIFGPRVSPDGTRVLVSGGRGREADLWVHESDRPVLSRLTFDDLEESAAIWSPDGRQIAFVQDDSADIKLISLAGGDPPRTIHTSGEGRIELLDWSRDGRYILLQVRRGGYRGPRDGQVPPKQARIPFGADTGIVYLERAGADGAWVAREFLPVAPFAVDDAVFSPDGRFVAYESNESEQFEVYVKTFPSGDQRWQVTVEGGRLARWRPDGKELYYLRDDTLFAVSVEAGEGFRTGVARPLFTSDSLLGMRRRPTYDVGPGNRFVVIQRTRSERPPAVRVALNWRSEFQSP